MTFHTIHPGECIRSLSKQYGVRWDTIWGHSENAALREKRADLHLLLNKDKVFIPDKQIRTESIQTEQRHTFRRNIGSTKLKIRLIVDGDPLSDAAYILNAEGAVFEDKTNGDGLLEHVIPADAREGVLRIEDFDPISLELGKLDLIDTVTGIQQRLTNLNYPCGAINGINGKLTKAAVTAWQQEHNLQVDGIVGPETRKSIENEYGC